MRICILGLFILLMLTIGCKPSTSSNDGGEEPKNSFKRVLEEGDFSLVLDYDAALDTSFCAVLVKGKKKSEYRFKGVIKDNTMTDLDQNGSPELYLFVKPDSTHTTLHGLVLEGDDARLIEVVSFEKEESTVGNTFLLERGQIVQRYGVRTDEGSIIRKDARYNLVKGSDGYQLQPQGFLPIELARMEGQYVMRDASGVGYYKTLYLRNVGEGIWNVDIKVKLNDNKTELCKFSGDGYFSNYSLLVPFQVNGEEKERTLEVRVVGLMASVYTKDPEESKAMVTICRGQASIAGNFKKTDI